jgi:alpha-glucoside transport system permease protein
MQNQTTQDHPASAQVEERAGGFGTVIASSVGRVLVSLFVPVITFLVLWRVFLLLRSSALPNWATAIVAIVWGVGGVMALFLIANMVIEQFPATMRRRLTPFVFVGPALAILAWYLFIPTVRSLIASLYGPDGTTFVGLQNYVWSFTSSDMLQAYRNNLWWLAVVTFLSTGLGLVVAVLADRTSRTFETIVKSLIFMPMVISMVGASIVWRFVYAFIPAGSSQVGLLNAIVVGLGGQPQAWLLLQPWNNFFLMIILVWLQTGYCMVILSAAIKGIPTELLEAARIDGANELQVFRGITVPTIRGTIITVATTVLLFTLKIFDIVQAMTGGQFGTQVIANAQYNEMFRAFDYGRAAAIAIVLLILVVPVMWYNLRQFGKQSEAF